MSDSFSWIIIILKHEVSTKRKNQILKDVDWSLSAEHKFAVLKKFALLFRLFVALVQLLHLGCVFELNKLIVFTSLAKKFSDVTLQLLNFNAIVIDASSWLGEHVAKRVLETYIRKQFKVNKLEQRLVKL